MNPGEKIWVAAPKGVPAAMVVVFLDRCRTGFAGARAALHRADFEAMRVWGHGLKGTGSAYGFPPLTVMGAAIEQAARGQRAEELREHLTDLEEYLGRVEVAL